MGIWSMVVLVGSVLSLSALLACQKRSDHEGLRSEDFRAESSPTSTSTATAIQGYCEHAVPGAMCPKCNPALVAVYQAKGNWCQAHGFPESFCPICKPDAPMPKIDFGPSNIPAADWCGGHGLPESKCTQCNPGLISQFKDKGDWCEEHGFPESVCPQCNPQVPPAGIKQAALEAKVVRLRSPELEDSVGFQTTSVRKVEASTTVSCTARIAFDQDRVADVRAIVPGIVRKVRKKLGAKVEQGTALFDLESTRVGEIQGALQTTQERVRAAQAHLERQEKLRANGIASARQVEVAKQELTSAQAEVRTAKATLRMVGASAASPSGRYTLVAPISGTIVRRPAVLGLLATESESLATIADTSLMWALCDVPEADASQIALGQMAVLALGIRHNNGGKGQQVELELAKHHKTSTAQDPGESKERHLETMEGRLTWIAAEVNPRTHTVTARLEVPNLTGQLRANQFASAHIRTSPATAGISVPRSAIQRVEGQDVVFVRLGRGVYQPRVVRPFRSGVDDWIQIDGRVHAGDRVVTTGAVLLRTEIMPGSIGAGCCEVDGRQGLQGSD